ncbi:hypothetical protein [Acidithiobacillus ferrivorans]|nr:hypothetical protein [Acidithiobacillus ferrivorans]MBU2764706.1 hypothetical protein [Acidithiobacillus ferrivorans]
MFLFEKRAALETPAPHTSGLGCMRGGVGVAPGSRATVPTLAAREPGE